MTRPLRIAQVAPPLERVPPRAYGGTERIVHELVGELDARGHEVTTFASGDSEVAGRHIVTVPRALRPDGFGGDPSPWFLATVLAVLERAREFDIIHSHVEWYSAIIASVSPVPVVTTWHGRLDFPWARDMLGSAGSHQVAISRAQASTHPDVDWTAVVHNGLSLHKAPVGAGRSNALAFVGRAAAEKGVVDAIEIARLSGRPIRLALKQGHTPGEQSYFEDVVMPAIKAMGRDAEYLGELEGPERDQLFADSYATLMPGAWPEPFGLVAIESLACGTPILARRIGALPEIIREGEDGFFGDDNAILAFHVDHVAALDRDAIRASVIERFSAARMADDYERLYRRLIGVGDAVGPGQPLPAAVRPPIRFETAAPTPGRPAAVSPAPRIVSRPVRPDYALSGRDRPGPEPEPERDDATSGIPAKG
jgi:glycosyltransferase involved in cell wall biosynthesis